LRAERFGGCWRSQYAAEQSHQTRQNRGRKKGGREIPSASLRTGSSPLAQDDISALPRWTNYTARTFLRCHIKTLPPPNYFRFGVDSGARVYQENFDQSEVVASQTSRIGE
jgi:hypothetical protein